jgi:hypothetical protein
MPLPTEEKLDEINARLEYSLFENALDFLHQNQVSSLPCCKEGTSLHECECFMEVQGMDAEEWMYVCMYVTFCDVDGFCL